MSPTGSLSRFKARPLFVATQGLEKIHHRHFPAGVVVAVAVVVVVNVVVDDVVVVTVVTMIFEVTGSNVCYVAVFIIAMVIELVILLVSLFS